MFKDTKAFCGFSVNDIAKAKQFYGETLGLKITEDKEMCMIHLNLAGGNNVLLYPKHNHQPATYTVLNFQVPDIEKAVAALKEKQVKFESYNQKDLKTDEDNIFRGGGPHIAWFTDPAGNILSVIQKEKA